MSQHGTIIIGAGLSGLACALTLQKAGLDCIVIENQKTVGGRVKTVLNDRGFLLDVGFQVLLSSYPELVRFVDLKSLNLQFFNSGALVFDGQRLQTLANPLFHPVKSLRSFFNQISNFKDKALVLSLVANAQSFKDDSFMGEQTTMNFLKNYGFSKEFISFFWQPFLTGIFLDPELECGDQFFRFLMNCFSSGKVSVPAEGMSALPKKIAENLALGSLRLDQRVVSWEKDYVLLSDGSKLMAKNVVCAFDNKSKVSSSEHFRNVTTFYFTSPFLHEVSWQKWLVLVPRRFGLVVDHFCLLSAVAESYSQGQPLLSASVVGGGGATSEDVARSINYLAGRDLKLKLISRFTVPDALPKSIEVGPGYKIEDGVYLCGDRYVSPSINGALRSGRQAAEAIINLKI
jgi:hypothetical protein